MTGQPARVDPAFPASDGRAPGADELERFHPAIARWFRRRFPDGPTEPQVRGWRLIADGRDTLIAAPTGSGKTLAGFLVAIDALYRAHATGADVSTTARVVYVSPLKALAVDVAENLEAPLAEIAAAAVELGLDPPRIRVGVRTGDTTAAQRAGMLRHPPSLIVTTPESLYLLLTSERGRHALASVRTVIVDEIHAVARDKRGAHLALSLERLAALGEHRLVRVGLSATQRPIETVGRLLVGDRPPPALVDIGHRRDLDVALEVPGAELTAVASGDQLDAVLDRVAELVRAHRTTLVFVNTRRLAERLAHQLGTRLGADVVAAHHGSLSKDRRHRVETRLRAGELRALVATASLELGIDIGPVECVCQIGSPRSIATFLQRVGRSNHSRGGTPKGRLFPMTRDELVECTALLAAVRAGELDAIIPARQPLDIAAQQLVAEVAARDWDVEGLFGLLRRAAPYTGMTRGEFDEVLHLVADGIQTARGRRGAYLHLDGVHGQVRARRGARLAATTSGGAIPETGDYRVVAEPGETLVGTVNEDWAAESMAGDVFLLGTHSWQIRRVEPGVVRVRDAGDAAPTVPFWLGEAPARTAELSAGISALRARIQDWLAAGDPAAARTWLAEIAGVSPAIAAFIVDYLAAGRAALGVLPTQSEIVIERFFDDTGGMQLVVHAPFGARINRGLGLALRKKFCRTFNFELQAAATDDAVLLSLGPHHSFPLADVPRYLSAQTVQDTVEQAVLVSPMFQSRWRWTLNRSLLVLRARGGKRNPPPIQRMESDDLLAAVFPQAAACQENVTGPIEIPEHLLVRQTMDDTLHEALDIDGLRALLEAMAAGAVRVHCRDTTEPSVLAHEVVTARPYAFLDDEERQNRRTNAVGLRRGIDPVLDSVAALDPAAIERVHAEVTPAPASPDELHDLLMSTRWLRAREDWRGLWADLAARGRGQVFILDGVEVWAATEVAAEAREALAGGDAGLLAALRGQLEMTGVNTAAELAERTRLPLARVRSGLAALEHEGFVLQGRYRPGAGDTEWVARRLLARMHSYSRRSRRESVQPVAPEAYLRFLLRWQHVAPGTELTGEAGLVAILEQLQGIEVAAASWERELFSRRLRAYDPAWLDRLCHAGDVAWLRLSPRAGGEGSPAAVAPSRATPIAVVFRTDLPWLLAAARVGLGASPGRGAPGARPGRGGPGATALGGPALGATAEVLEVLRDRGACFATDLAVATRRLPEDIERALWDGVRRGLVMCDGFAAIRARLAGPRLHARPRRFSRIAGAAPASTVAAGRWALVPEVLAEIDADEVAEAVAEQLLTRWGVLVRELAVREGPRLPWREVQRALRRLEDRGLVRGGRFVAGFPGEQFALPAAAEELTRCRDAPRTGERVVLNATDPLNLVGLVVPGQPVPAVRTRRVVYVDGLPQARGPGEPAARVAG